MDGFPDSKIEDKNDNNYVIVLDSWRKILKMAILPL